MYICFQHLPQIPPLKKTVICHLSSTLPHPPARKTSPIIWNFQKFFIYLHRDYKTKVRMSEEKRAKIISMIRDTIREAEPTAQIILYGSRARGDAREDSDWDVLAIVDKPRLTLEERGNIQYPIWDKGLDMGEEINVFPYTKKQWDQAPPSLFKYNVLKEGINL